MNQQKKPSRCPCCEDAQEAVHCPVESTLALIGGKYKALILWKLVAKTRRFSDLQRQIPAATAKMLTQQLRELERDGLVRREVFPVVPPRVEYSLTPTGMSIKPVLLAMYEWGERYLAEKGLAANCGMEPLEPARKETTN